MLNTIEYSQEIHFFWASDIASLTGDAEDDPVLRPDELVEAEARWPYGIEGDVL